MLRITKRLLLWVFMLMPILAMSQVTVSQYGMDVSVDSTKWVTLPSDTNVTKTILVNAGFRKASNVLNIGFDFNFAGTTYTQFSVNTDGNIRLGATATTTSNGSTPFSTANAGMNAPKINGLGCEGKLVAGGYIKYAVMGTAPNRKLVVEFKAARIHFSVTQSDLIWQVQLYETSNDIQLVYGPNTPLQTSFNHQIGMSASATDVLTVNNVLNMAEVGATDIDQTAWPVANTCYRFYIPSCIRPFGLQLTKIGATSADFKWNRIASQVSWDYVCVAEGVTPNWMNATTVYDTIATVPNLRPNTDYVLYLRSNCGLEGGHSNAIMIPFTTECNIVQVPYFEKFEAYAQGDFPACWRSVTGESEILVDNVYTRNSFEGKNCLKIQKGDMVVLPKVNLAANEMMLNAFVTNTNPDGSALQVGYITDITEMNFVPVESVAPMHSSYQEFIVDFSSVAITDTAYVAIKCANIPGSYTSFYLDNVSIVKSSTCNRPEYAYVSEITHNSAKVEWNADNVESYVVAYALSDTLQNTTKVNVLGGMNSYVIPNLASETRYFVWVRSVCENDSSMWRPVGSFVTKKSCASVLDARVSSIEQTTASISWIFDESYGETASSVELSYKLSTETEWSAPIIVSGKNYYFLNGLMGGYAYNARLRTRCAQDSADYVYLNFATKPCGITTATDASTTDKMPFGGFYKYSYSQMLYPASALTGVDTIKGIAFNVQETDMSQTRKIDVYIANTAQTALTTTSRILEQSMKKVATNASIDVHSGWVSILFDSVFVHNGTSNLVVSVDDNTNTVDKKWIVYYNAAVGSSLYNQNSNLNINPSDSTIEQLATMAGTPQIMFISKCTTPSCAAPVVAITDITSNSIHLAWVAGTSETQWVVEYKAAEASSWTSTIANTTSHTISGLLPSTHYDVRVGTVCGTDTLFANLSILTDCGMENVPLIENFDDDILTCWTIGTKPGLTGELTWIEDSVMEFGYKSAAYLVTPQLQPELSTLQATFTACKSQPFNDASIEVLVGNDPTNFNSFIAIDTIFIYNMEMAPQIVYFDQYVGSGHYIMFSTLTGFTKLDNIKIETMPACSMPTDLAITDITSEGATLTWVDRSQAVEKWLVSYTKVGDTLSIVEEVYAEDGPIHVSTTLDPVTEYNVTVATICTTGDTNETMYPISFQTSCADVVLPYNETFDNIEVTKFHPCWFSDEPAGGRNFDVAFGVIIAPSVFLGEHNSNTVIMSANKAIASPLIPLPANQISLNFDAKFQDTVNAGKLVVGFVSNPTDTDIMVVDTLICNNNDWHNYTIDFNRLSATDTGYVVFKNIDNIQTGSGWSAKNYFVWLDNINFSQYNSCVRPYQAEISNITATTANVAFQDSVHTGDYTLAWNTESDLATATTLDVDTTFGQLTNLQAGTTYHVWVRANCSASTHSSWVSVGDITTGCNSQEIPYVENFDSYIFGVSIDGELPIGYPNHVLPDCWNVLGMNPKGREPYAMLTSKNSDVLSGSAFSVKTDPAKAIYAVLPQFSTPLDSLMIQFSYRNGSAIECSHEFVLGIMTNPNDPSTFVALEDCPITVTYSTIEHVFLLDNEILPNTNYYIAFRFGGVGQRMVTYIENISVDNTPTCVRPIDTKITSIRPTSATVTWNGTSDNYEVQYRLIDTVATSWTTLTVNTNQISLTSLLPSKSYELQVRGVCGEGVASGWSKLFSFTMPCAPSAIPWSENFESFAGDAGVAADNYRPSTYPNHTMPECWQFSPMTKSGWGGPAIVLTSNPNDNKSTSNSIEGVSMRFNGGDQKYTYAILPLMDADIDTLALYFDYAMTRFSQPVEVGVVTNPNDFSTYIPLETYPVYDSSHAAEHYFALDELDATQTYYIAIVASPSSRNTMVIDNIRVEYIPSCINPSLPEAYSIMDHTAMVKWNDISAQAQVSYRVANNGTWVDTIVNDNLISLSGLQGSTTYELKVRSVCGNGDSSAWTEPITFTTECNAEELPFIQDFTSTLNELTCWSYYNGLVDSILAGVNELEPQTARETDWKHNEDTTIIPTAHATLNIYGRRTHDWMVSPLMNITPGALLSFDIAFSKHYPAIAAEDYDDDRFYVLATADGGTSWTKLVTWGPDSTDTYTLDSLGLTPDSIGVSLRQFYGQTIRIAFYGESTVDNGDNDILIDNILVDTTEIICDIPTNIVVTPQPISATITWEGEAQTYEIAIRESGATDWSEAIAVTGLTHTFTELMPATTYEYRLRQMCAEDFYSDWVGGAFVTLELPCATPVVTVSDLTGEGATFTWDEGENHQSWEVHVFNTVFDTTLNATTPTLAIENLEHATEYNVAVRANCAENVYSDWSDTVQFTTLDCLPVTGVAASDITKNSAIVTWTAGADETSWEINYGEEGFAQGEGIFQTVEATTYTITGLTPETAYDVYVRAICSENFYSIWSTPVVQFTTLADEQEGIDGVDGHFQFVIYPNPTTNSTTISLNGVEGKVMISVVDMNGRTVANETIECGVDCEKAINVNNLAQGTYFVRVLGNDINSVRKLIVR